MDQKSLRALIIQKLADGRLPHDGVSRVWGGPGNNETCVACDLVIGRNQMVIEAAGEGMKPVQFHVKCFYYWDMERSRHHELGI